MMTTILAAVLLSADGAPASVRPGVNWQRDIVFAEEHGVGLLLDVAQPQGGKNGLAIIDVVSGSYSSSRRRQDRHEDAGVFSTLLGAGYTVFAVRPGSRPRFVIDDMVKSVRTAIRWVKARGAEFGVDPERIGLFGTSAGGHLACLAALTPEPGDAAARDPIRRWGTEAQAVVAFFPPTDFLQFGYKGYDTASVRKMPSLVSSLVFPEGTAERKSPAELFEAYAAVSPARRVTSTAPPTLLIHGDADLIVPVQQSQVLHQALTAADVPTELVILPGAPHGYGTLAANIHRSTAWFDRHLKVEASSETKAARYRSAGAITDPAGN